MEAVYYNRKLGGMHYPLAFIATLILLLLNANSCSGGAAVGILVKSNSSTTFGCDGRLDECLMEEDLELELLINPYISRILQSTDIHPTEESKIADKPVITCGKVHDPYLNCIGPNGVHSGGNCGTYKRNGCESGHH